MALTQEMRTALMRAREIIATNRHQFICHALYDVKFADASLQLAVADLEAYIAKVLCPYHTLGFWQKAHGFGMRLDAQRSADRLAWIDWMLGD